MSRGKKGFFAASALLALSCVLLLAGSAAAQLVPSDPAGGLDNLAPAPVTDVAAAVDLAGPTVTVSWSLADDDYERQTAAGSDLTSGGVFISVNDVAEYIVWRRLLTETTSTAIDTVTAGTMQYLDSAVQSGNAYVYSVSALDAAGNESAAVAAPQVSLGPPPQAGTDVGGRTVTARRRMTLEGTLPPVAQRTQLRADMRAAICQLVRTVLGNDTFPCERVRIVRLAAGSIVVTFEVLPDATDPATDDPAAIMSDVSAELTSDPTALTQAAATAGVTSTIGSVTAMASIQGTDIEFGDVAMDATATETITISNSATDPDALLYATLSVTGDGFAVSDAQVTVTAGQSADVTVSFDAAEAGNVNGAYEGELSITTNDPADEGVTVALTATIVGGLDLATVDLSGTTFNFAQVVVGETKTIVLTITNAGDLTLEGTLTVDGGDVFTASESAFSLAGGEAVDVDVVFAPMDTVAYSASLMVASNDAEDPEVAVALSGSGVEELAMLLIGDFDGDGTVGFPDFFMFADNFGKTSADEDWDPLYDLDDDGSVGFPDFFIFADHFGETLAE